MTQCNPGPSRCQIPGFCTEGAYIPGKVNCDVIVGYKSVYRMCFAMACFFFLFSIIMIRVRSSKDPRAAVQNGLVLHFHCQHERMVRSAGQTLEVHLWGFKLRVKHHCCSHSFWVALLFFLFFSFWFFKFLVLLGITVGAFFIPDGVFSTGMDLSKSALMLNYWSEKAGWSLPLSPPSVVLLWHGGLLHLHHHPAHPAGGLRPLLEPVLAGEGREWKQQVLVCRWKIKHTHTHTLVIFSTEMSYKYSSHCYFKITSPFRIF